MAKYGKAASRKVASAERRRKRGTLTSGSGRKVTSRKQAIAIGLSEARESGGKVPAAKGRKSSSRKSTKSSSRKSSSTSSSRKSTSRKSTKSTSRKGAKKR